MIGDVGWWYFSFYLSVMIQTLWVLVACNGVWGVLWSSSQYLYLPLSWIEKTSGPPVLTNGFRTEKPAQGSAHLAPASLLCFGPLNTKLISSLVFQTWNFYLMVCFFPKVGILEYTAHYTLCISFNIQLIWAGRRPARLFIFSFSDDNTLNCKKLLQTPIKISQY